MGQMLDWKALGCKPGNRKGRGFDSLLAHWSFGTASSGPPGSGDQHDVMELVDMQARDACAPPKACGFDSHHRDQCNCHQQQ